jgi:hypothetical protein
VPKSGRGRSPVFFRNQNCADTRLERFAKDGMKAACGDDWPGLCLLWPGLELIEAFGGLEEGDAVAEEFFFGKFYGGDDLGGNENGGLANDARDGDFDEGAFVVGLFAFETQAAARHVLAGDDVVAALGMANEGGGVDLGARMLAALLAGSVRVLGGGQRHGEDRGARLLVSGGPGGGRRVQPSLYWR